MSVEPPLVDYAHDAEFQQMLSAACEAYASLISSTVRGQIRPSVKQRALCWTPRERMVFGIATFPELRERNLQILLTLTKHEGGKWAGSVNEDIISRVTDCCRTYFNAATSVLEYTSAWLPLIDRVAEAHLETLMVRTMTGILGCDALVCCALRARCFSYYTHPLSVTRVLFVPRGRVPLYALALAAMTHERLGEHSAGRGMTADAVEMIWDFIKWH